MTTPVTKIVFYSLANGFISFVGAGFMLKMAHRGWDTLLHVFPPWFIKAIIFDVVWMAIAVAMKLKGNVLIFVPFVHLALLLMVMKENGNLLFLVFFFTINFAYTLLVIPQIYKLRELKKDNENTLDNSY